MPFWSSKTLFIINILYIPKKIYEERRTIRLILNGILPTRNTSLICSRRASAFTSKKGSITVWKCRNCGHIHVGMEAPTICPVCKHPQAYFEVNCENY